MSKGMKVLAIQTNSDGRPCGWGIAEVKGNPDAKKQAREIAASEYARHCCYPGERKGEMLLHIIDGDDEE